MLSPVRTRSKKSFMRCECARWSAKLARHRKSARRQPARRLTDSLSWISLASRCGSAIRFSSANSCTESSGRVTRNKGTDGASRRRPIFSHRTHTQPQRSGPCIFLKKFLVRNLRTKVQVGFAPTGILSPPPSWQSCRGPQSFGGQSCPIHTIRTGEAPPCDRLRPGVPPLERCEPRP